MPDDDLWCGHVGKVLDGSSVQLLDTGENQGLTRNPGAIAYNLTRLLMMAAANWHGG